MAEPTESHRGSVEGNHDYASVGQFIEVLSEVTGWYTLATLLGAPTVELDEIQQLYRAEGVMRCLIEVYKCLEKRGKSLVSWEAIANALKAMKFEKIADKIYLSYIKPSQASNKPCPIQTEDGLSIISKIVAEYESLFNRFDYVLSRIKHAFRNTQDVDLTEMQDIARRRCGLAPLPQEKATFDAIFNQIEEQCSIVNFNVVEIIVERLLDEQNRLRIQAELRKFKLSVDRFKLSANMVELVSLIKTEQTTPTGEQKMVKLKVREFWNDFTMKQFETIVNEIFLTLYDIMTHVTVSKGCICLNWIIPDIDTTELLPVLPLELVRLIGVIYLYIGSDIIYNIEGEGCESIEAAMLQAIELKNTQAVELLLAVGCNPEVATYSGDNAVTNIVNIRAIESKESSLSGSSHSVDHVWIFGHNKHVEAIVDPAGRGSEECSSCVINKKMVKHLHQENNMLRIQQKQREMCHDIIPQTIKKVDQSTQTTPVESTEEGIKIKDAEITLLKKNLSEALKKEMTVKGDPQSTRTTDLVGSSEEVIEIKGIDQQTSRKQHLPLDVTSTSILRQYQENLCSLLDSSSDTLESLTVELYSNFTIDESVKNNVLREKGYTGARILLDAAILKVKQSPRAMDDVFKAMETQKILRQL